MEVGNSPTFTILSLPKLQQNTEPDNHAIALARKFRELRLLALKTAPEAFAASYDVENERGLEQTLQRLNSAKAIHFIAIEDDPGIGADSTSEDDFGHLLASDWVGMIVLLGPETEPSSSTVSARSDPFARMTAATSPHGTTVSPPQREGKVAQTFHYHLNGVFVSPSARKSGLGRALIAAALAGADFEAQRLDAQTKCSILVDSENRAARGLYEKAGFLGVGEETYVQQPRALVVGEPRALEKVALLMELERGATHA